MIERSHIETVCKYVGRYKGNKHVITACVKNRFFRFFNKLIKRNLYMYTFGEDWKVLDEQGTAFVGPLNDCINYFLRHESENNN